MNRELIPGIWGRSEDYHQGRNATNRVPHFSPMSGKPDQDDVDNEARAIFWRSYVATLARSYVATLALVALCVLILANWPN